MTTIGPLNRDLPWMMKPDWSIFERCLDVDIEDFPADQLLFRIRTRSARIMNRIRDSRFEIYAVMDSLYRQGRLALGPPR